MKLIASANRRSVLKAGVAAGSMLAMPGILRRAYAAQEVNVAFTGSHEAAAKEIFLEPFSAETGIQANFVVRRTAPVAEVKMMVETGTYPWDVVATLGEQFYLEIRDEVEPLDFSQPELAGLPFAGTYPGYAAYEIPAVVMAYNHELFTGRPPAWEDMPNTAEYPGGRTLERKVADAAEIALRMTGVAPEDVSSVLASPEGWDRVKAGLDQMRPSMLVWWPDDMPAQEIINGEITIAPGPTRDIKTINDSGAKLRLNWDRGFYQHHGFVIPKGSPNAAAAQEFIRFALKPERIAAYTERMGGPGPVVPGAIELVDPAIAATMPTYPDNLKQIHPIAIDFWINNTADWTTRFNEWLLQG